MSTAARITFLLLVGMALAPEPSRAQRDCCFGASSPPIFDGARLAASTMVQAVERSERLGFAFSDPGALEPGSFGVVRFRRGGIVWAAKAGDDYVGLSARRVQPLVSQHFYVACYPPPPFRPFYGDTNSVHPNTAIGIVGAIGIVDDIDGAADRLHESNQWDFGDAIREDDLGAEATTCTFMKDGFLRLVSPLATDSRCAAWLPEGSLGRWIGVVIECADLTTTAAWFDTHGVRYAHVDRGGDALRVDPVDAGGVLFEFVSRGWRPRA